MKRFYLFLIAAATVGIPASFMAKEIRFSSLRQSQSVKIPFPVAPDSISKDKDFDQSSLLGAKKVADLFHRYQTQDWTTVIPDTTGTFNLKPVDSEGSKTPAAQLHTFVTRIRPDRFVKGNLVTESTSMLEVFVNGESKIKKTTADSVAKESKASISLDPAMAAEVEVHILNLPDDKEQPKFSLRFIPDKDYEDVNISEGPDVKRHFSLETTQLGTRLTNSTVSPDGKYVLISFTETFGEKDKRSWKELRTTGNLAVISTTLPSGCRWMPKGSTLYFTERTSDGYTLYSMPASTLSRSLVAEDVPVEASSINWAPDGKWFLYYDEVKGKKNDGVMRRVDNPDDRMPGNRDRFYLKKFDIGSGVSTQLTYGGPSTILQDISSDSKKILYTANLHIPDEFPFYNNVLIELDANTLETDTILSKTVGLNGAIYSPDAQKLFIWASPNEFDGIGRATPGRDWANDYDTQGFLYDLKSRKVEPLTRDFDPTLEGKPVWNRADGKIYVRANRGFYLGVCQIDPRTRKITELPVKADYVGYFSIGEDEAKWLTYTANSYTSHGSGYILNLSDGKSTLLADPMASEFNSLDMGESSVWKFTSKNGDVIDGTVTLPPDFDPSRKYPLIVYYYGGTSPCYRTSSQPYTPQLLASRGYVVYVLNPSGTTGYGQEFSARHVNAWGDYTADEIIEGVKKFCQDHPYVNDKKIGCMGASYGGFMTQLLQTKTDIFACAVSHAGISNVASYWGEGYWGYSYNSVAAARSYPWNNPDLFTKHGSLFNADKIHTPLLLLHGTVDTNVPIGESIQLFNALRILGRDVEFITVEDQNHIINDINKKRLWHATIMAWFAKYLQDDPRWWDSMYGK